MMPYPYDKGLPLDYHDGSFKYLGQLRLDFYKNSVDRVLTRDPCAAMRPVSFNARLVPNRAYKDGEDFLGEFCRAEHIIVNHTLAAA